MDSTDAGPQFRRIIVPLLIALVSWALFCLGAAFQYSLLPDGKGLVAAWGFVALAVFPTLVVLWIAKSRTRWWPWLRRRSEGHTGFIDLLPDHRLGLWIALAAGTGLYLELVVIRFHASCFQLFAFFKNVSLLSCFLGLGVGYAAGRRRLYTPLVIPMIALQLIVLQLLRFTAVADALQNPISEQFALGLDPAQNWTYVVTAYGFLVCVFVYNAACFVPLGQIALRLMSRRPPLEAYSWNLIGSLGGIAAFYLMSFVWAPPAAWVSLAVIMLVPLLRGHLRATAAFGFIAVAVLTISPAIDQHDIYSPYQILTLTDSSSTHPSLQVNHIYYQKLLDLSAAAVAADPGLHSAADYYNLPYVLHPHPASVLVVGSGTGNDVASAVRHGAGHVDADEIDPAILAIGRQLHPESPYESPTVSATVQDARAFIRHTPHTYDLIVYGLLDSHTLLSGASSVRLDSYIYTVQAFREARAHLRPGGVMCVSFCMVSGQLGRKLYLMIQDAFDGQAPVVYRTEYDGGSSFVIGNPPTPFSKAHIPATILATDMFAGPRFRADVATDDWPFFYMPVRTYPITYLAMIVILLAVSITFVRPALTSGSIGQVGAGFSAPCFFLGTGFMLLETKAITELALYYGSTWVVTAVVIAAILALAFLANWLLLTVGRFPVAVAYVLLLGSVGLSLYLSSSLGIAALGLWSARAAATAALTLPLFFAGLAFSTELGRAPSMGAAMGSNLIGAMLGGCLEYNSMYFGYHWLYWLAIAVYALAFATSVIATATKPRPAPAAAPQAA